LLVSSCHDRDVKFVVIVKDVDQVSNNGEDVVIPKGVAMGLGSRSNWPEQRQGLWKCITFAAENAESSLGTSHRKNQYAITLQEDYIIAFYNHFCACQLSQHDLAAHSTFPHSLQPVLTCAGRAFSLISLTMASPNLRLFPTPATQVPGFLRLHAQYMGLSRWISV
jgi:hypothetical protein